MRTESLVCWNCITCIYELMLNRKNYDMNTKEYVTYKVKLVIRLVSYQSTIED